MADKKTLELQIKVLMQQAQQQIKTFATEIQSAASQIKNLFLIKESLRLLSLILLS